jgi:hypothetical protein
MADAWPVAEHAIHLLAMAVMVGGSAVLALAPPGRAGALRYEWAFWTAAGLAILTGVGNLGLRGALAPADTAWGEAFQLKLASAALLLLFSFGRCVVILRGSSMASTRTAYAATVGVAALTAVLGVGIADG